MKLVGKVLWWDAKYQRGVIIDAKGNEYYFDSSCLAKRDISQLSKNRVLHFSINEKVTGTLAACAIFLPALKQIKLLETEFEKSKQLQLNVL